MVLSPTAHTTVSTTHGVKKVPSHPRILRRTEDLFDSLKRHVRLLKYFAIKAFHEGEEDYLGEVAGKLRVLVYGKGRNTPLLLSLIEEFSLHIPITLDGPPVIREPGQPGPGDKISLREYLSLPAFGIKTRSGFVMLNRHEIIGIWAQQNGAAHEDWSLDEPYSVAKHCGLFIGGYSALALQLKVTTETVLEAADKCIELIDPKFFKLKDAERWLKKDPDSHDAKNAVGIALANLGENQKALQIFYDVVSEAPNHFMARNNQGLVLLRLNDLAGAAEALARAVEVKPDYSEALYNLGCVHSRQGKYVTCLDLLTKAINLDGSTGDSVLTDPDLEEIRNHPEYGPRLRGLFKKSQENDTANE